MTSGGTRAPRNCDDMCLEIFYANEKLGRALTDAREEIARMLPVFEKAQAWRRWFPLVDSMFNSENELIAAVDALGEDTRKGALPSDSVASLDLSGSWPVRGEEVTP